MSPRVCSPRGSAGSLELFGQVCPPLSYGFSPQPALLPGGLAHPLEEAEPTRTKVGAAEKRPSLGRWGSASSRWQAAGLPAGALHGTSEGLFPAFPF